MSSDGKPLADLRYAPTDGLTYNPNDPLYWDPEALQKELDRAYDLCHGCRMCFKFCQSFPTLFTAVDEHGDVRRMPRATHDRIVDECFQCKLCYTQCPYTEAEGHEFKLDFPRLMTRAKAVRRRAEGFPLRERMLADPDMLGKIGTFAPALANWANRFAPNRALMETFAGIHRNKLLPPFESPTFPEWFRKTAGGPETHGGTHKVVLFATCFVDYNRPAIGKAAYEVLAHNDCRIACPDTPCCGMPALDAGDIDQAKAKARAVVNALAPYVERGYLVAVLNPTCSLTIKQEYHELLDDPRDRPTHDAAKRVAAATRDMGEFLYGLQREGHFKTDFASTPNATIAYHAPCHLRMQKVGFRSRDLMRKIPGTELRLVQECCGHDGTWAMKKEYFELSQQNGRKAFDGMKETGATLWTSDCPLAGIQFEQACGVKPLHPVEVLARAYRPDGFEHRVPAAGAGEGA